jgi:hypothetical protein
MDTAAVRWTLVHLNDLTWLVAQYRVWLIVLATVAGFAVPLLGAARRRGTRPAPASVVRGGALALAFSSALVMICALLHFSDLRWLSPAQRGVTHLSSPGGVFSFARPIVTVVNSVADIPVEYRAAQVAVHTAVVCAFLALAALFVAALTWRRARRADIRQIVRDELRRPAASTGTLPVKP